MLCKRVFFLALCLGVLPAGARGQSSDAKLEGTVKEGVLGAALPGAEIEILRNGALAASTSSGEKGAFWLPPLSPGRYTLRSTLAGYRTVEQDLELKPRDALDLVIELVPDTTVQEQVEVSGAVPVIDPQRTGSSVNLTREMLESLPATITRNVPALAQNTLPGAILGHDNFVHVRGNELSLHQFVNGVSFLDNPHEHFFPGLSPEIFENVNMVTGGFRAEFGNRFGGILDITTRSGAGLGGRGNANVALGTVGQRSGSLEYGDSKGRWGYYLFGGAFNSDRFLNPPEPDELHDQGHGGRGVVQVDYEGDRDLLKFLVTGGASRFQLPNLTEQQELGRDAHRALDSQSVIASWRRIFSDKSLLSAAFYERQVWDDLHPTSDPVTSLAEASRSTLTLGGKVDWYYSSGAHRWKAGVDVTRLRLRESFDFDAREPVAEDDHHDEDAEEAHDDDGHHDEDAEAPHGDEEEAHHGPDAIAFQDRKNGHVIGVYVQDSITPLPNLTLDLGVRFDQYDIANSEGQVSPRLGAAYYFPGSGSVVRFSYNRLFTPPPIEYILLASYLGNLPVEGGEPVGSARAYRQHLVEGGVSQRVRGRFYIDVGAYHHTGENSFENSEIADTRLFVPTNFSHGRAQGVELEAEIRPPQEMGISGRIQYALAKVEFEGPVSGGLPEEHAAAGQTIPPAFDQRHTVVGDVAFRHPWMSSEMGLFFRYGSGTPVAEHGANGDEVFRYLPSHVTLDISGRIALWASGEQQLGLEVNLTNLTDNVYQIAKESESTPIQYAPRRAFSAQLRWNF